ncbi:MAG TPA: FAD-dependent oxidoreductase [Chthonomonadaceae bacterium]|nr:FAD-dependent oxidoreductase [Chthonomonadaceae bacterium]
MSDCGEAAFPTLSEDELAQIAPLGEHCEFDDGAVIFKAGDRDIDLWIVEAGELQIINPTDGDREVVVHLPGEFAGDIDLLTRRPVVVTARCRGRTQLMRVPGARVREVLLRLPQISEKLMRAFQERRRLLRQMGNVGLTLYGPADCRETNLIREFLDKNFVPFVWRHDDYPTAKDGSPLAGPIVDCGNDVVLSAPTLQKVAHCAGVWQECPVDDVELAIVGAGPAGMSAAVYAASEGISTLVLDRLGPGGQAAASSKIENFIGFPSGLSGTELATRAVIQFLKFGANIVTPVHVQRFERASAPGEPHMLHLDCGATVRAMNVLIASGLAWRQLSAIGNERLDHAGVYYACTTTETVSHQGEDVAVVGGGNSAGQAAMFLAEQCANRVHLLVRGGDLGASMSSYLVDRIHGTGNIDVHLGTEVTKIDEDGRLRGIEITSRDGQIRSLQIGALFVFIGASPQIDWLPNDIARDSNGYILTGGDAAKCGSWPLADRAPCTLETTIPRLFAAGDVRSSSTKRVGFAVGDGALAVACVHSLRQLAGA